MPLRVRGSKKLRSFDLPVSFRVSDRGDKLRDALNVFSNQGRLETRFGRALYNSTSLGGSVLSTTFFKSPSGSRYLLAKVGSSIYQVATSGASPAVKTGLTSTTKHRAITWSRGSATRQIIACESDGLFQFDGTTFTQLGQAAPVAPTVATSSNAGTLTGYSYSVYLTYYSSTTGFESNASAAATVTINAQKIIQDLTFKARQAGGQGNLVSIAYVAGGTAGAEVVTVTGNAISVSMATGTSTAFQIKSAIEKSATATALVDISVSGTGTNTQVAVAATNLTGGQQSILVSAIPTTAANATIDRVRVYLKNTTTSTANNAYYVTEFALGTTSYTISADTTSTSTFPFANAAPLAGGARFLTEFNRKLVYAGNSTYKNDVYVSEQDLPDAFNDGTVAGRVVLYPTCDGEITGLATGLYNNTVLEPFLVIFKKRSTHIYSEIGGSANGKLVCISSAIGCVSHDTIRVKNGNVYFLSDQGWRVISNGSIALNQQNNPATLGNGDIDDIFKQQGYVYGLNRAQMPNAFSVYYSTLDQYMTWVAEGSNQSFTKTYVYEFGINGFKPYSFFSACTSACVGEDASGDEVVFMSDTVGSIYTHSIKEDRNDDDSNGTNQVVPSFGMLMWQDGDDMASSYNFRELIIRRVVGSGDITVKTWRNYSLADLGEYTYTYSSPSEGFQLDVSALDTGIFGDDRTIVTARADINRVGENILIGFYQNQIDGNIGLVSAQLDFNKNGNRN